MQGEEASQPKKKKKKGNELLVFVLLPQQCPSCSGGKSRPAVRVAAAWAAGQAGAGRMAAGGEEEAAGALGLVASCHALVPPDPARVRTEPAAPLPPGRSSNGSARGAMLPDASSLMPLAAGHSMTGPEPLPEAAPHTLLGLANKGGCAPPACWV